MTEVDIVYRSRGRSCGINLFSERLGYSLSGLGFRVRQYNLLHQSFKPGANTIIHYVPSMWAGDGGALERVLKQAEQGHIVAVLHGIYGPREDSYLKETLCPQLHSHIHALGHTAKTVIALSNSCKVVWHQWGGGDFAAKVVVIYHPGAHRPMWYNLTKEPYLFLGGISRPKKNIMGERLRNLLFAYSRNGIKVWVHISNSSQDEFYLPVWRLTSGVLPDKEWFSAIAHATAVLCPYETKIQCVSGIMAEAISLGTRVISTDFMFASEMKQKYTELVHVEDDLLKWPVLPQREKSSQTLSCFPTWEEFADKVATFLWDG